MGSKKWLTTRACVDESDDELHRYCRDRQLPDILRAHGEETVVVRGTARNFWSPRRGRMYHRQSCGFSEAGHFLHKRRIWDSQFLAV